MFHSIESLVKHANGNSAHRIWIKYFTKDKSPPKDFANHFPQLSKNSQLFEFKPFETRMIKRLIGNITDSNSLTSALSECFMLNERLSVEFLDVFMKVSNLNPNQKKSNNYLFSFAFRYFIKLTYQISSILEQMLDNDQPIPQCYENLYKILFFFSLYSGNKFSHFHEILVVFLSRVSFRFDDILRYKTDKSIRGASLTFLGALVSCSRSFLNQYPNLESPVIRFITEQLEKISILIDPSNMNQQVVFAIRAIVSSLIPDIKNLQINQSHDLGCVSLSILASVLRATSLDSIEIYSTGIICMKLYNESCKFEGYALQKHQFGSIVMFIIRIITTCPDAVLKEVLEPIIFPIPPNPLPPMSREYYFSSIDVLRDAPKLVFSERLSQIAQIILAICSHFKDPSPFIAHLIESIKEQESSISDEMYRTFVGFVLTIIGRINENILTEAINNNWSLLISPLIFPPRLEDQSDTRLRDFVNVILLRAFVMNSECRFTILDALFDFLSVNGIRCILYFMPLMNSLLMINDQVSLVESLLQSRLLSYLLQEATNNLLVFDFLRHAILLSPQISMENSNVIAYLIQSLQNPVLMQSCISLLSLGLSIIQQNKTAHNTIINIIKSLIKPMVDFSKDFPDIAELVFDIIGDSASSWNENVFESVYTHQLYDSCSLLVVNNFSEKCFINSIDNYYKISRVSVSSLISLTQENQLLYSNIMSVVPKLNGYTNEIYCSLFQFLLSEPLSKVEVEVIRNSKALEILLDWSNGCSLEKSVISRLNDLGKRSNSNLFQLNNANIQEHILKRFSKLHSSSDLISPLLELFAITCRVTFTNNVLYSTIQMIKEPSFQYPQAILSVFQRLLSEKPHLSPPCFFHFDGNGTGIFGPQIMLTDPMMFLTTLKIDSIEYCTNQPVVTFQNGLSEYMTFSLCEKKMVFKRISLSKAIVESFNHSFEPNVWYEICILFTSKGVSLFINGAFDSMIQQASPPFNCKYSVYIGALSDSQRGVGLVADLATTFIFRSSEYAKVKPFMTSSTIPESLLPNLVFCYSPRSIIQNQCISITSSMNSVPFRGRSIQYVSNVSDVFFSVAAIPILLPMLSRLERCQKCKGCSKEYCEQCGSLSLEEGNALLVELLNIFTKMFEQSPSVQKAFESINGPKLLSSYFHKSSTEFFDIRVFMALESLYSSCSDHKLAIQMIDSIWFNFALITKLDQEIRKEYFSTIIYRVYKMNKDIFNEFDSLDFLIYRALIIDQESAEATFLWDFISKVVIDTASPVMYTTLLSILAGYKNPSAIVSIIDIINYLISNNSKIMQILMIFDSFLPFILTMGCTELHVQQKAISMIYNIASVQKNNPIWRSNTSLYTNALLMIYSQDSHSSFEEISKFTQSLLFEMKNNEMQSTFPELLPHYFYMIQNIGSQNRISYLLHLMQYIISSQKFRSQLVSIPFWYYWIMQITKDYLYSNDIYDQVIASFSLMISEQLTVSYSNNQIEDIINYLLLESFNNHSIPKDLMNRILVSLLKNDKKNDSMHHSAFPKLIEIAVNFLLFQPNIEEPCRIAIFDCIPQVFHRIIPNFPHYVSKFTFGLSIDKEGKWIDQNIALTLLPYINKYSKFEIKICNHSIDIVLIYTYLCILLARFDQTFVVHFFESLITCLKYSSYDTAYTASSMLLYTINRYGVDIKDSQLKDFHQNYQDDSDSIEFQKFQFEDLLCSLAQDFSIRFIETQNSFIDRIYKETKLSLKIDSLKPLSENIPLIIRICLSQKGGPYQPLIAAFERFSSRQKMLLDDELSQREKLYKSFVREISYGSGPWSSQNVSLHYKASSSIGLRGSRILMKINHCFDNHQKAADLRDSGISNAAPTDFLPKFKSSITTNSERHEGSQIEAQKLSINGLYSGKIYFVKKAFVFEGKSGSKTKNISILFSKIEFVLNRKQNHVDLASEVFTDSQKSYYFVFNSNEDRSLFYNTISPSIALHQSSSNVHKFSFFEVLRKASDSIYQKIPSIELIKRIKIKELWLNYELSTYEYLYYLNLLSGRSFNDISQYPVFPWIIKDYNSNKFNIHQISHYRDLSLPIGALNQNRLSLLLELYKELDDPMEKCIYRSHFSNLAVVSSYLIRVEPFTTLHILLQEGRFDLANRLFYSVVDQWNSVSSEDNDFRELIPEFFSFPQFLINENMFNLGIRLKDGVPLDPVNDVILPKWAKNCYEFILTNRVALESEITSMNISKWIDLIFGVNRKSDLAKNVFHRLSYPENERSSDIPIELVQHHCTNFGVYPDQLFSSTHEPRCNTPIRKLPTSEYQTSSTILSVKKMFVVCQNSILYDIRKASPIQINLPSATLGMLLAASRSLGMLVFGSRYDTFVTVFDINSGTVRTVSHETAIIKCASVIGGRYLITGGGDCSIRIWRMPSLELIRVSSHHSDRVVAVSGNADIGIVVSIDKRNRIVIETLMDGDFIRYIDTNVRTQHYPFILVFKSGLIVVAIPDTEKSQITTYDPRGVIIATTTIESKVLEISRITDSEFQYFAVGCEDHSITILNPLTLEIVFTYPNIPEIPSFCSVPKHRGLMIGRGSTISYLSL